MTITFIMECHGPLSSVDASTFAALATEHDRYSSTRCHMYSLRSKAQAVGAAVTIIMCLCYSEHLGI
jgi:hypothetical protein